MESKKKKKREIGVLLTFLHSKKSYLSQSVIKKQTYIVENYFVIIVILLVSRLVRYTKPLLGGKYR